MGMKTLEIQRVLMVDDKALGVRAIPVAYVQLRMLALIGDPSHKDSILLSPQLV